jgi:hypothetical protein
MKIFNRSKEKPNEEFKLSRDLESFTNGYVFFVEYFDKTLKHLEDGNREGITSNLLFARTTYNVLVEKKLPEHYHPAILEMKKSIIDLEQKVLESGINPEEVYTQLKGSKYHLF